MWWPLKGICSGQGFPESLMMGAEGGSPMVVVKEAVEVR